MEPHLPYGITQCYLLPDTGALTPGRLVLNLPTLEGRKAEFILCIHVFPYY